MFLPSNHCQEGISLMYAMWRLQLALCTVSVLLSLSSGESKARSCSEVRQAYNVKGFSLVNVPHQEISGRRNRHIRSARHHVSCLVPPPPFLLLLFLLRLNNLGEGGHTRPELCDPPRTSEPFSRQSSPKSLFLTEPLCLDLNLCSSRKYVDESQVVSCSIVQQYLCIYVSVFYYYYFFCYLCKGQKDPLHLNIVSCVSFITFPPL